MQQCAAVETTDLFLELLAFLWGEGVCFGDQRDDIDFLMQPFHELDVQGLQSAWRYRNVVTRGQTGRQITLKSVTGFDSSSLPKYRKSSVTQSDVCDVLTK